MNTCGSTGATRRRTPLEGRGGSRSRDAAHTGAPARRQQCVGLRDGFHIQSAWEGRSMNRDNTHRNMLAWSVAAALASLATAASAQEAPASGERQATTLDALIVTAQKREEALQDVPITMSVLPEQLLQDSGARDIKEMQSLVSGLSVSSTSSESQTTVRIRGVGTVGDNPGLESSVGVVIDGVYRPRNGVGFGD